MPRHWGLRAAAGKVLKSFTAVCCASGKRFAAVPETSGERRRHKCASSRGVCCSTCAVSSRAGLQLGQMTKQACCAPLSPGATQATPVLCGDPCMLQIVTWMDTKMPWSLEQGSYVSSVWVQAGQRSTSPPACFSAVGHGQSQKGSASSNETQRDLRGFYLKAWSVLAAAICCVTDWYSHRAAFLYLLLFENSDPCLLLPGLLTPTGGPDHRTSQGLTCGISLCSTSLIVLVA